MLTDYRIRDAINEGKEIGAELDENSIERLDIAYSKHLDKTSPSIPAVVYGGSPGIIPWSQRAKGLFNFTPIIPVDEFFEDDPDNDNMPYSALRKHSLELSPAYPIIGAKPAGRHILYNCEICRPEFTNINLSSIEHHCKYKDPDRHKAEIISRLEGWLK